MADLPRLTLHGRDPGPNYDTRKPRLKRDDGVWYCVCGRGHIGAASTVHAAYIGWLLSFRAPSRDSQLLR
jgi:hypothetical protein